MPDELSWPKQRPTQFRLRRGRREALFTRVNDGAHEDPDHDTSSQENPDFKIFLQLDGDQSTEYGVLRRDETVAGLSTATDCRQQKRPLAPSTEHTPEEFLYSVLVQPGLVAALQFLIEIRLRLQNDCATIRSIVDGLR